MHRCVRGVQERGKNKIETEKRYLQKNVHLSSNKVHIWVMTFFCTSFLTSFKIFITRIHYVCD